MLQHKQVRSVLNKHKKRDSWFLDDYSVNPYEGCSCNCLYCYIRGSRYGENMEQGLAVKSNLPEILDKQLAARARKGQYGFVAIGSATDAYLPHEENYRLTRSILELLLKHRFPVFISTKRALILRDLDLLHQINEQAILPPDLQQLKRGLILSVSVSTMNEKVSSTLEPGAITPLQRMELVERLNKQGLITGVNAIPVLPFISDTEKELEKIILAAKAHAAGYVLTGSLTLFGNDQSDSRTLFYKFLERYDPSLLPRYDQLYGNNFFTPFAYQEQLRQRAAKLCHEHGIRNSILA